MCVRQHVCLFVCARLPFEGRVASGAIRHLVRNHLLMCHTHHGRPIFDVKGDKGAKCQQEDRRNDGHVDLLQTVAFGPFSALGDRHLIPFPMVWCYKVTILVLQSDAHGVTEYWFWCYRVAVMVLQSNGVILMLIRQRWLANLVSILKILEQCKLLYQNQR
jgi:hypothetical protein